LTYTEIMNNSTKEIIVSLEIGNEQKQIILAKKHSFSSIYDIMIDKEYHGQVQKVISGWVVNTIDGSWLQVENYEPIVQAVINAERPNS
jgi:ribosomal protein L21E